MTYIDKKLIDSVLRSADEQVHELVVLATKLLDGKVDKAGNPVVDHAVEMAVGQGTNMNRVAIALMHDVLEDTDLTAKQLTDKLLFVASMFDFAPFFNVSVVVEAVEILTRKEQETYAQYIQRIVDSRNTDAIAIKIEDIENHLENSEHIPQSLIDRYSTALVILDYGILTPPDYLSQK